MLSTPNQNGKNERRATNSPINSWLRSIVRAVRAFLVSHPWIWALAVALFMSLLVTPSSGESLSGLRVGQFADRAIKADRDFNLEDTSSTEMRRQEAALAIIPVYDHDTKSEQRTTKRVRQAFQSMRDFFGLAQPAGDQEEEGSEVGRASLLSSSAVEEQETRFLQTMGIEISQKDFKYLRKENYSEALENELLDLVKYALSRLVVNDRQVLTGQVAALTTEKVVTLRDLHSERERNYTSLENVLDVPLVIAQVEERAKERIGNSQRRAVLFSIAKQLIGPTLDFNRAATEDRRKQAEEQVGPSLIHFRKNQLIVAEGDDITEEHLVILRAMNEGTGGLNYLLSFLAIVAVLFIGMVTLAQFAARHVRKFTPAPRDIAFLASAVVLTGLLAWVGKAIAEPLATSFNWLTVDAIYYLFPLAAVAMLVRLILHSEASLILVCITAPLAGLVVDHSLGYAFFVLIGSLVGANYIGHAERRGKVTRAGLLVGLVNMATAASVQIIGDPTSILTFATPVNVIAAFVGGMLTGPLVLAILPLFESGFGYTSNLQLMELANLNHPLLERMLVEAPGTYHHCLSVSALSEKGAEAIGANPLLAKVSGLYHDIGKINKPQYFIENQFAMDNPHDTLPPRMSSLILIAHVREGVDAAVRYRLGERIEQIIAQHHGTSRIRYFYERAKQLESDEREKVEESDFRYKGPKPQSKEAALVLMADVVEAATRSLKEPTPSRIKSTVADLIDGIYADGQLDDCEMTLRDLRRVADQFVAVLNGRFHGRIEYPEGDSDPAKRGKVVSISTDAEAQESETTT